MRNNPTILVTGAGAPGIAGTLYALRNNPDDRRFRIITTDINNGTVGQYLGDGFYQLPPPENSDYIPTLREIVKKENIRVIVPQTTREINVLSKQKEELEKDNTRVMVSSYPTIQKANDKHLVLEECKEIGIPFPHYFLVDTRGKLETALKKLRYPERKAVIKPTVSNGMRGLRIISEDVLTLQDFLTQKPAGHYINRENLFRLLGDSFPPMLVSEYIPGHEYTVDVYRNPNGIVVIPRLREQIRSGISFQTRVELREDIVDFSERLAHSLDLLFCFGFQFKMDAAGVPKILECNPRVQGTMIVSHFAGFNMIYYGVKELLGENVEPHQGCIKDKILFSRYWGGIGVEGTHLIGKI